MLRQKSIRTIRVIHKCILHNFSIFYPQIAFKISGAQCALHCRVHYTAQCTAYVIHLRQCTSNCGLLMHNITWHIVIGPVYGSIAVRNTSIQPSSVLKFKSHIIVLHLETIWFSMIYSLSSIHQYVMPISIAVTQ